MGKAGSHRGCSRFHFLPHPERGRPKSSLCNLLPRWTAHSLTTQAGRGHRGDSGGHRQRRRPGSHTDAEGSERPLPSTKERKPPLGAQPSQYLGPEAQLVNGVLSLGILGEELVVVFLWEWKARRSCQAHSTPHHERPPWGLLASSVNFSEGTVESVRQVSTSSTGLQVSLLASGRFTLRLYPQDGTLPCLLKLLAHLLALPPHPRSSLPCSHSFCGMCFKSVF